MKTFIFGMAMIFAANLCFAESNVGNDTKWTKLGSSMNDTLTLYVNQSSKEAYKGNPSAWFMDVKENTGLSTKNRLVANCKEHRLFILINTNYDANGKISDIFNYYKEPAELTVEPDSMKETFYNFLCKRP